ncbi:MAG: permease prefix domain 2-containing transporter [Pseudomonadota bacterium]
MTANCRPPRTLETLVSVLAPKAVKEDLLGDLEEDFRRSGEENGRKRASIRYLVNVLRLTPFFVTNRFNNLKLVGAVVQLVTMLTFAMVALAWETALVQKQAWPITAQVMEAGFLPAVVMYFSVYTGLYVVGIALMFRLNQSNTRAIGSSFLNPYLLATVLTVMPIVGMVYPMSLDSRWMRGLQVLAIWAIATASAKNAATESA